MFGLHQEGNIRLLSCYMFHYDYQLVATCGCLSSDAEQAVYSRLLEVHFSQKKIAAWEHEWAKTIKLWVGQLNNELKRIIKLSKAKRSCRFGWPVSVGFVIMWLLPIAGTAMPILDTTTCMMACLAALGDSPNRFPFSSVTGIPYFNSLEEEEKS